MSGWDDECGAAGPGGVTCWRWPQPAAHTDRVHESRGGVRWPYTTSPVQLDLLTLLETP